MKRDRILHRLAAKDRRGDVVDGVSAHGVVGEKLWHDRRISVSQWRWNFGSVDIGGTVLHLGNVSFT